MSKTDTTKEEPPAEWAEDHLCNVVKLAWRWHAGTASADDMAMLKQAENYLAARGRL